MTDPMYALASLQAALIARTVALQRCELHPEIGVLVDEPNPGSLRFTYAKVDRGQVLAIAMFVKAEPVRGVPCFQVGYAVADSSRRRGLGAQILQQGIDELKNGLRRTPMPGFYLEAVIADENEASCKIAARVIGGTQTDCKDCFSGEPSQQFLLHVPLH